MRFPSTCALAVCLAAALSPLAATTVERLTFAEIVSGASAIVHGRVVGSSVGWDAEHTMIWTHYEIQVTSALRGRPGAVLRVSEPGGEVDGKHMQVVGAPRYQVGEEVVVFAAPTAIGLLRTCGWGQGKFSVSASAAAPSGRVVRSGVSGVTLVDAAKAPATASPAAAALDGADFEAFLVRIRTEIQAQEARGRL